MLVELFSMINNNNGIIANKYLSVLTLRSQSQL